MTNYRTVAPGHMVRVPLVPAEALRRTLGTRLAAQRALRAWSAAVEVGDWPQARGASRDLTAASYELERIANEMRPLDPNTEANDARD